METSKGANIPAEGTAQKELLAVGMGNAKRALVRTRAHGDGRLGLLGEVVTLLLPRVAVIAEVGLAPAVPGRDGTAKLALPLQEVLAVRCALGGRRRAAARAAHEVRGVEGLLLFASVAPSLPREVGVRALEAHEVRVSVHCVPVSVVEELAARVRDLLRFRESLEFQSLGSLLLNHRLQLPDGFEFVLESRMVNGGFA